MVYFCVVCVCLPTSFCVTQDGELTDLKEALTLLQVAELKGLCKEFILPSSLSGKPKPQLIEGLVQHCKQHKPIFGSSNLTETIMKKCVKGNHYLWMFQLYLYKFRVKKLLGMCVRVCPAAAESFSKIMLLFSVSTGIGLEEENDAQRIMLVCVSSNLRACHVSCCLLCLCWPINQTCCPKPQGTMLCHAVVATPAYTTELQDSEYNNTAEYEWC